MTVTATPALLSCLVPATRRLLRTRGVFPLAVPAEFARRAGGQGRFQLRAFAWNVGVPVGAECRCVYIRGQNSEVFNALVFPTDPTAAPVFVADFLLVGGQLRLAFLDLQGPGLAAGQRTAVALATCALAAELPSDVSAPAWAVAHSLGGFCHARGAGIDLTRLLTAYDDYLRLWLRFSGGRGAVDPDDDTLTLFKEEHRREAPAAPYLGRLFGTDWTERFLRDFLYR